MTDQMTESQFKPAKPIGEFREVQGGFAILIAEGPPRVSGMIQISKKADGETAYTFNIAGRMKTVAEAQAELERLAGLFTPRAEG